MRSGASTWQRVEVITQLAEKLGIHWFKRHGSLLRFKKRPGQDQFSIVAIHQR